MSKLKIKGSITNKAPHGAGTPIKNSFDILVGFSKLVLNLAKRMPMHKVYITVEDQSSDIGKIGESHKYITKTGNTPKFTKSHKVSSSAPKVLVALSNLANLPSRPSIIAATIMQITAFSNLPSSAILKLFNPIVKAINVKKFGKSFSTERLL
jgi:hypothetical protein